MNFFKKSEQQDKIKVNKKSGAKFLVTMFVLTAMMGTSSFLYQNNKYQKSLAMVDKLQNEMDEIQEKFNAAKTPKEMLKVKKVFYKEDSRLQGTLDLNRRTEKSEEYQKLLTQQTKINQEFYDYDLGVRIEKIKKMEASLFENGKVKDDVAYDQLHRYVQTIYEPFDGEVIQRFKETLSAAEVERDERRNPKVLPELSRNSIARRIFVIYQEHMGEELDPDMYYIGISNRNQPMLYQAVETPSGHKYWRRIAEGSIKDNGKLVLKPLKGEGGKKIKGNVIKDVSFEEQNNISYKIDVRKPFVTQFKDDKYLQ